MEQQTYQPPALILPQSIEALTPLQKGWLQLAQFRIATFDDLQKDELAIQNMLNNLPEELEAVQGKIKEAKQLAAKSKEQRLHFTGLITDKLFTPAMEFEKRNEALIAKAAEKELDLRRFATKKAQETNAKQAEEAELKAHIQNEYFRLAAEYRQSLATLISEAYVYALNAAFPMDQIPKYLEEITGFLEKEKVGPFAKKQRRLISDAEAMAIFTSVPPYKPDEDLAAAVVALKEKFTTYELDLQNNERAAEQEREAAQQQKEEAERQLKTEQAINTLTAASIPEIEVPKIKVNVEIIEENTEAWAQTVITTFMKHWHQCSKHLKVKSWAKLSLAQMGAALAKENIKADGLKFKEVEK